MADSNEVMEGLKEWRKTQRSSDLVFSCLTPNLKGLELAVQAQADEIAIFGSASEEFSQRNINCSIQESLERFAEVAEKANELNIPMRGYVSCVMVRTCGDRKKLLAFGTRSLNFALQICWL